MSTSTINRTHIGVNDDGTGTTGTVVDTGYVGLAVYDQVDALIAAQLNFGSAISVPAASKIFVDGGGNTYLYESSADILEMYAGGVQMIRMRGAVPIVDLFNDVGIQPTKKLYLDGGSNTYLHEVSADRIRVVAGGQIVLDFLTTGGAAANVTAPGVYNTTSGAAANVVVDSSGQVMRSTSSRRYKTKIRPFGGGLADLLKLHPMTYVDKKRPRGTRYVGFIAEDLDRSGLGLAVNYDDRKRPDAIQYERLSAWMVNAFKEQQAQISKLQRALARRG